jgi:hypothetical protein
LPITDGVGDLSFILSPYPPKEKMGVLSNVPRSKKGKVKSLEFGTQKRTETIP